MRRRGLIAAGIAATVIGALSVAWTLNAQAEQTAAAPAVDVDASTAAPVYTPPALLPWGEKPKPIRTGRYGTRSDTLRSEGLAAARGDAGGSTTPRGRYGAKGHVRGDRPTLKATGVAGVAPEPSGSNTKDSFYYNIGAQEIDSDGFFTKLTIARPKLAGKDYHTLAELAAQSADLNQTVEVGWNVDKNINNGNLEPHLFVYHWVNNEESCYNGCGWQQVSKTVKPGDILATGIKNFGIQHENNAWWISYDSEFIGFFPDTLWTAEGVTFDHAGYQQVFGEVASPPNTLPCSEMGTGTSPADPETRASAAYMASFTLVGGKAASKFDSVWTTTDPSWYQVVPGSSGRTYQYGGGGSKSSKC